MARDGNGNYDLPEAAFVNGTTIDADAMNSDLSDIAAAITDSIASDGQTVPTANLPMGGFKHTNVAVATARTDYARTDQVIADPLSYAADTGTADAIALAPSPGVAAYVVGQKFRGKKISSANATTTPTAAVNGLDAGTVVWPDGSALAAGDMPGSCLFELGVASLSGSTPTFHLLSVAAPLRSTLLTTRGDIITRGASLPQRLALGTSGQGLVSDGTDAKWGIPVIRGYIAGLITSNNAGTPNTKVDVAAGVAADDTRVLMLSVSAGTIDCGTTGTNGLDTGSLANNTWYHIFAIGKTDGTTALLASTSLSSPTFPNGYTLKRRIGSFKTDGSAHIKTYIQNGDNFHWKTPIQELNNATGSTTYTDLILAGAPTGVKVRAYGFLSVTGSHAMKTAPKGASYGTPTTTTTPAANAVSPSGATTGYWREYTDTAATIQWATEAAASGCYLDTEGWDDDRGKND
jgi:hypothetical protein